MSLEIFFLKTEKRKRVLERLAKNAKGLSVIQNRRKSKSEQFV